MRLRRPRLSWMLLLIIASGIVGAWAAPGIFTSHTGTLSTTDGTVGPLTNGVYKYVGRFTANNTFRFGVSGYEGSQPSSGIVLNIATNANGNMTLVFIGTQPSKVLCTFCGRLYNGYEEIVTYQKSLSDVLTLLWPVILPVVIPPFVEAQKVLYQDDFLGQNVYPSSLWTQDRYSNSSVKMFQSQGYLVMSAQSTSATQTIHIASPVFSLSSYSVNNTQVKRKMTVALIPFVKAEANTANLKAGFSGLLTSGAYPGSTPYGTPFIDTTSLCGSDGSANDHIGADYIYMRNDGVVVAVTCGDGGFSSNILETVSNPSLYTVFTVETRAIFCTPVTSVCSDNALHGSTWVYFRVYQETPTGMIIQATDTNLNVTSNVAPLFQTTYAFIAQTNSNSGATGQVSKIDFVNVQNFGSPVCLVCQIPRIPVTPSLLSGFPGVLSLVASLLGGGNLATGGIVFYFLALGSVGMAIFIATKSAIATASMGILITGIFIYAALVPVYFAISLILLGGYLGWGVLRTLSSGGTLEGAGGE